MKVQKNSNKKTLADKIAGVLNTTPASFDPEDDCLDETRAKLLENISEDHEDDEELLSSFRRQNIELLADVDKRYEGKKANRRSLHDSDDDLSESDDQFEQEIVEDSEGDDDVNKNEDSETVDSSEEDEDESQNEESLEESDGDESPNENVGDEPVTENTENFRHFKEADGGAQIKKGLCVRHQMSMWENLLEIRIQLQKCLISANKMPQKEKYSEIKKESPQEFSDQVAVTKNSLTSLLDKLMLLQKLSLSKYPETKKLKKTNEKNVKNDENDEEIPSDTEEEEISSNDDENESEVPPKKKRKLNDIEKDISERYNSYKSYRNSVIQKWNEKTRIAMLKNNTNSHSVINHIEHTLSDRTKLVNKTQLKRSDYSIIGQDSSTQNDSEEKNVTAIEEHNTEIFDDDDFYHQLLRELIEVKSADLTDPIQLGRQWIQLQKLRSKMKRKIDTKATKGRKIRYTVHTKLVNFMAPIDEHLWTDQAKTELFSSLFGKKST